MLWTLSCSLSPRRAEADDYDLAKAAVERGTQAYRAGDFPRAQTLFQEGWERYGRDPLFLRLQCKTERALEHRAAVLQLCQRYVTEGGAELSPADRQVAERLIEWARGPVTPSLSRSEPERLRFRRAIGGVALALGIGSLGAGGALLGIAGRCYDLTLPAPGQDCRPQAQWQSAAGGWGLMAAGATLSVVGVITLALPERRKSFAVAPTGANP